MVQAIRRGKSVRAVAAEFGVNKATVERWIRRTKGQRLDRVDWLDQPDGSPSPVNRCVDDVEQCVLELRKELKENSALGEHGADAILREMERRSCPQPPSRATINRILKRHGELDGRHRKRFLPPPPGWYLTPLAKRIAELDQFDFIEDLCIQRGTRFQVLNGISLHGGLVGSWPMKRMTSENTVRKLIEHWSEHGLPDYAQFDNATIFQGSRWPDTLGKVMRCCLSLEVIPVFAPPRETGFQASVESYNGRWEQGIPPREDAVLQNRKDGTRKERDKAIIEIDKRGRKEWKKRIGYHRRSLSETGMYRIKTLFGGRLKNRKMENQKTEVRLRCKLLNKLTTLGMPKSVPRE